MVEKTKNVSSRLIIFSWAFIIVVYVFAVIVRLSDMPSEGLAFAMGYVAPSTLIPGILGIRWFAPKNVEWASKINKNQNIAYTLGFLLNILGILIYWIYYKVNIHGQDKLDN